MVAACVALLGGCYNVTRVAPDQLPLLNDTYHQVASAGHGHGVLISTVRHVRALDGRMVRVQGGISAIVRPRDPAHPPVYFQQPLRSELTHGGAVLHVTGANRPETLFMVDEIERVELIW